MSRLTIGLALLALSFGFGFGMGGSVGTGLIALAVMLLLLPPEFDPAIIWKEHLARNDHPEPPSCFGQYPFNAGLCAERDCPTCPSGRACVALSRKLYRKD